MKHVVETGRWSVLSRAVLFVLLAGLVVVDIANALLCLVLPEIEDATGAPMKVDETPMPSKDAQSTAV